MTAPEFTAKLHRLVDPALTCYMNPIKGRFVIDRCKHPEASSGLHKCNFECIRTNVMIVETPDGKYRDLGDDIIGALHAMDTWSTYGSAEAMNAASDRMDADHAEASAQKIDETYDELARDNKRQLRQAFHLIQQHNTAEVH